MSRKLLISFILGTRPEVIKLAPVINCFKKDKELKIRVILTGQHREMVETSMKLFSIKADIDLNLMLPQQSLEHITCKSIEGVSEEFKNFKPNMVIVQGDTTTAFAASLAAFYKKIPIAHVEAGLRTNNLLDPYPEEINRRFISQIASLNFAPTLLSRINLENSAISGKIHITGNTVIDALFMILKRKDKIDLNKIGFNKRKKIILTTIHRRENLGDKLVEIIAGIKEITNNFKDVYFFIPMHPNPLVRNTLINNLNGNEQVILSEPLSYDLLVNVMKNCFFVLTDSGGLQEEAPSLGKPVLVLRNTTERIESIQSGTAKLIGTNKENIVKEVSLIIQNEEAFKKMSNAINPYGDGNASEKILNICKEFLRNN